MTDKVSLIMFQDQDPANLSTMAIAPEGWEEQCKAEMPMPNGLFGQKIIVTCGGITLDSAELDMEFTVPFDDDEEPNEAKLIVYNLTANTISQFEWNSEISIMAGYGQDTGIIFSGRVSMVLTDRVGLDKRTTITAIDDVSLDNRDIISIAYKAGTTASYILKDLLGRMGLPIAVFKTTKDETYIYEMNVEGSIQDNIRKFADMCGTSVYIHNSKVYVRDSHDSEQGIFKIGSDTGMIESPEAFQEEVQRDGYQNETVTGYKVKMLLQNKIITASTVEIDSILVKGQFRVRGGEHTYNGKDFITEIEVL